MRISPLDIRQQQFTVKWLRGFDIHEVDAFLDDIAEDYEAVLKENAQLKEQVGTFEERSRGLAERERALLPLRVQPRASRDEIVGWQNGALRVRVTAPPVAGAANAAISALLAGALRVPPSSISVVRGTRGRDKLVRIAGLDDATVKS